MRLITLIITILSITLGISSCKSSDNDYTPQIKAPKEMKPINFSQSLQKNSAGENEQWSTELQGKNIITISNNQKASESFISPPVARYQLYKKILEKRKEGFKLPQEITMDDLLQYKTTPVDKLEDDKNSPHHQLESDHYKHLIVIEGNLVINRLDLNDALYKKADGLIVKGDLLVNGGINNSEGDYGPALIVKGNVVADYIIAGGSEIYISGEDSYIHSFIFSHYNHGILRFSGSTSVFIQSDHNTWLKGKSYYKYDVYEEFTEADNDFPSLKAIFTPKFSQLYKEEGEDADFKVDHFINFLTQDSNNSLILLKRILDANHADNPTLVQVMNNGSAIKDIENPTEIIQIAAVTQDGMALQFIKNASENVQITAVASNPHALEFIQNPSHAVQTAAVKSISYGAVALNYIKNPSDEIINLALSIDGSAIQYLENPSEVQQLIAVKRNSDYVGTALEYIKNPTEKVKLVAVQTSGDSIKYIENPSEEIQLAAIRQDGSSIEYIQSPSEAVKLAAVKQAGWAINYIPNPSERVQLEAIKQSADDYTNAAIKYIKDPTEKAQLLAISFDKDFIELIKNPTQEVRKVWSGMK